MDEKILDFVKKTELSKLGELFNVLVKKVSDYRLQNNDFLPMEIFSQAIGIGGNYVCMEIVPVIPEKGYILKLRDDSSEQDWKNLYQIPGITFTKGISESLNRLKKEIFGESKEILKLEQLEFAGAEIHFEQDAINHRIYDNATCIIMQGDTSTMYIC